MVRLLFICHCGGGIFPIAFFPQEDPTTALLISFSSLAVGFLARPSGDRFWPFGDRIGRKRTLVVALMMMGITTTLIGFYRPMRPLVSLHRCYLFCCDLFKG